MIQTLCNVMNTGMCHSQLFVPFDIACLKADTSFESSIQLHILSGVSLNTQECLDFYRRS